MEEKKRKRRNKKIPFKTIAEAYRSSMGIMSVACRQLGIDVNTFKAWKKDYPELNDLIEEVEESNLDFAESKLFNLIQEENLTAIIFYLKSKGKHRGYIERTENDVSVTGFEELMKSIPCDDD